MGIYPIDCSVCGKTFLWFSGNLDQRCPDCQKPDENDDKEEDEND